MKNLFRKLFSVVVSKRFFLGIIVCAIAFKPHNFLLWIFLAIDVYVLIRDGDSEC